MHTKIIKQILLRIFVSSLNPTSILKITLIIVLGGGDGCYLHHDLLMALFLPI